LFTQLILGTAVNANQIIGSILKVKGEVSILELGNREAKKAIEGQKVTKEASILTSEKSFIQIVLLDKTQINLGPSSKIILDQTPVQKIGLISLMKGALRTNVVKELGGKDKLYIKTRTAAMGIRGTDFLTNYNPENKMTNLITFRGQVAMVKTESLNVEESLSHKEIVLVDSGKFAAISNNLKNVTEPIKLSPVQYTGLKLNTEMNNDVKIPKEVFQNELKETIKEYGEISKKEIAENNPAKQEFDPKKQVLRPTAGGFVDLVTGIYVPPTVTQNNYNKELNIYELKAEKGEVTDAGVYIPPKGIILDAQKGFIVDPKNQNAELHAELKKLNNDISEQVVVPEKLIAKPNKDELGEKTEDAYKKYFIKE
jgi:hypothetical protein